MRATFLLSSLLLAGTSLAAPVQVAPRRLCTPNEDTGKCQAIPVTVVTATDYRTSVVQTVYNVDTLSSTVTTYRTNTQTKVATVNQVVTQTVNAAVTQTAVATSTVVIQQTTTIPAPVATTPAAVAPTTTAAVAPTTTAPAATTTAAVAPAATMISGGYYPDWDYWTTPPSMLDYSKFDVIYFAFAVPTSSYTIEFDDPANSPMILTKLVTLAHAAGKKVYIAIGGWTDSKYFSKAVENQANRIKFIASIKAMMTTYSVDGVDIDWEYPGTNGNPGNYISSSDSANYLLFLQALREAIGTGYHISSCAAHSPFIGSNGSPLTDVSAFANVLDSVLIMNYDVWGSSSNPGANAPLSDACTGSYQPNANANSGISAWNKAGMPLSKIMLGLPGYGYISSSSATTLVHKKRSMMNNRERATLAHRESQESPLKRWYQAGKLRVRAERERAAIAKRDERKRIGDLLKKRQNIVFCPNNHSGKPCEGVTDQNITSIPWKSGLPGSEFATPIKVGTGDVSGLGNQIAFSDMINYGTLVKSGTSYIGANGYVRYWDSCSSTPYLVSSSRKVVITYDDPDSIILKAQLAKTRGIGGALFWDAVQVTVDDGANLMKAARSGMGLA